jgi:hypothetical protein
MPRSSIQVFVTAAALLLCALATPAVAGTNVFVNGRELTQKQIVGITLTYHYAPIPGRYWVRQPQRSLGTGRTRVGWLPAARPQLRSAAGQRLQWQHGGLHQWTAD